MRLSRPKAVLFDWDNTLVDTWPVIHAALHHTFTEMMVTPWTLDEVKGRVRKSMRDSFPELFGENWEKAGKMYQEHYQGNHLANLQPLPRAKEVLQLLKAQGIYTAVVSNKRGATLREEANHLGWTAFFNTLVGSDDAARDKPHCEPVILALTESGFEPGPDVWFIGDSEIDLECSMAVNCTTVLFGDPVEEHHNVEEQLLCGFPYLTQVKTHAELLDLLKEVM